jgi:hypothetical protein
MAPPASTISSSKRRRRASVAVVRADAAAGNGSSSSSSSSGGGASNSSSSPAPDSSSTAAPTSTSSPYVFRLGDGDVIFVRPPRQDLGPSYSLSWESAVDVQLAALRNNDRDPSGRPHPDHGVEVLYRFADFNPFERARYFGRSLDLGQFERFRRVMHSPHYRPLLNHTRAVTLSTLRLGERCWRARVLVEASDGGSSSGLVPAEERVYEMTMVQRLGGVHDGYWFTSSLVAEGNDWSDVLAM